ncbi:MAG: type 1 glutamine amidotransferase domain-containing protein [Arthrobacter sp.]|uniref:type 1 glutamine amidotransferase domain-containing protein n=1 Tax=Arthrobacter TaxID=1663 RepID=UPI00264F882D|nr:type 1 glutamine amidotransferase [Micrococcaceae bacterium]MDN5811999.1 type 1 glutamine amidotransferase [Micrococcaceae bacterium]MDN5823358.1 type 1 glutamine amidotransferase [Micrococcaceae bacterium]MDN5878429.1 type 1 glutamine amidotransferase [Micrococcaceae bacterium]MDN5887959.1 type 1 glutamine amidotransferase [Micrococcaceae bacterium]
MANLNGRKILVAVSNRGVEQDELTVPLQRLRAAGAEVTVAAPKPGEIETLVSDWEPGDRVPVDATLADVEAADYDLLLLPGGTLNADALRLDDEAQRLAKSFAAASRPVASICHGPWLLVETGLTRGKTLTSYLSIRTDVENSGGTWKDQEVFRCPAEGWTLITSRNPGDLDAFTAAIENELAA